MKTIAYFCAAVALAGLPTMATAAGHAYDNGPVWDVSAIQTKPGHFEDYMKFLATTWRSQMEGLKKKGVVLDYKVLNVQDARDNEADLYLMVEYRNMAALDAPLSDLDASATSTYGSVDAAMRAGMDRESIRTTRGDMLTRELILK